MTIKDAQKRLYELGPKLRDIAEEINALHTELQEIYDMRSDKWQDSQTGYDWQDSMDAIEEWAGEISEAADNCPELVQ